MLHGDTMSSNGFNIPMSDPYSGSTYQLLENWMNTSIPNSKIILALTTAGLEPYMVNWFKELIAQYGFAGMSVWGWSTVSSCITVDCIEDASVNCSTTCTTITTTTSACTAKCTSPSPYAGECCDSTSTTDGGSCATEGQEGCCGGNSGTTYCQKT